jgi:membrane fusion protein, copper/silver efflux system
MATQHSAAHLVRQHKNTLIVVSVVLVAMLAWFGHSPSKSTPKPLYWVSSMDPNYRSDKPGKCPHGMDLIPVYAQSANSQSSAGIVSINPAVQNQLSVRKAKVVRGILNQQLRTFGRVVADPTQMVQINPRTPGWVDMLFVASEGESVKRGQALFSFYSPQLIAAQEQFLAARKQGEAQAVRAEGHLKALVMDDISIEQLKTQGVAQQSVVFHAPLDGVVDMLKVRENAYVQPGQMVMALGAMERVWVELQVFASQANLIQPHQAISLTSASFPGKIWEAEVDSILPNLDGKSRTVRLRVSLANPDMQLRPTIFMQGLITLPARKPALLVLRQAIIEVENQTKLVLDLGEGKFKTVAVQLGQSNSELVEVLEGINEGDIIVTSAQFLIDSESSKSSDLKRLQSPADPAAKQPTWVTASITEIFPAQRKIQISHNDVPEWGMPGMTMNFALSAGINIDRLKVNDKIRVKIADGDPLFKILEIQPLAIGPTTEPTP